MWNRVHSTKVAYFPKHRVFVAPLPHARSCAFTDQVEFELPDRSQHVEKQSPCRCGSVDPLVDDDEIHAQGLKFGRDLGQVTGGAGKPVELHYSDCIELSPLCLDHHLVQRRSTVLRARDPVVHELLDDL